MLIVGILLAVEKKEHRPGTLISLFLMLHAAARFLVEFIRYSAPALQMFTLANVTFTSYQLISLVLFVLGGSLFLVSRRVAV